MASEPGGRRLWKRSQSRQESHRRPGRCREAPGAAGGRGGAAQLESDAPPNPWVAVGVAPRLRVLSWIFGPSRLAGGPRGHRRRRHGEARAAVTAAQNEPIWLIWVLRKLAGQIQARVLNKKNV